METKCLTIPTDSRMLVSKNSPALPLFKLMILYLERTWCPKDSLLFGFSFLKHVTFHLLQLNPISTVRLWITTSPSWGFPHRLRGQALIRLSSLFLHIFIILVWSTPTLFLLDFSPPLHPVFFNLISLLFKLFPSIYIVNFFNPLTFSVNFTTVYVFFFFVNTN